MKKILTGVVATTIITSGVVPINNLTTNVSYAASDSYDQTDKGALISSSLNYIASEFSFIQLFGNNVLKNANIRLARVPELESNQQLLKANIQEYFNEISPLIISVNQESKRFTRRLDIYSPYLSDVLRPVEGEEVPKSEFSNRLTILQRQVSNNKESIQKAVYKLDELKVKLDKNITRLSSSVSKGQIELGDPRGDLKDEVRSLQKEINSHLKDIASLPGKLEDKRNEMKEQLNKLFQPITKMVKDAGTAIDEVRKEEANRSKEDVEKAKAELAEANEKVKESEEATQKANEKVKASEEAIQKANEKVNLFEEEVKKANRKIELLEKKVKNGNKEMEEAVEKAKKDAEEVRAKLDAAKEGAKETRAKLDAAKEEAKETRAKLDAAKKDAEEKTKDPTINKILDAFADKNSFFEDIDFSSINKIGDIMSQANEDMTTQKQSLVELVEKNRQLYKVTRDLTLKEYQFIALLNMENQMILFAEQMDMIKESLNQYKEDWGTIGKHISDVSSDTDNSSSYDEFLKLKDISREIDRAATKFEVDTTKGI